FSIGSVHHLMPVLALGTAASPPPEPIVLRKTVLEAIKLGYRHFDTSPRYQTEEPLGEALAEAVSLGLVQSRSELFVTSKLWCADAHNMKKVEMSPVWQQRKLRELCKSKGIVVTAYSVLGSRGAFWGTHKIMESDVLKEIAEAKGKTVAQVSMRWAYEEGVSMVVKSFTKERLEENLKIIDWSLTEDEKQRISTEISQSRIVDGEVYISEKGPIKSVAEMWDGEI
ncbi:NADP-dependent oxidoreductase domain superfamily, partial [Arabidopsis thaliana x Arabidopsis arenosa]